MTGEQEAASEVAIVTGEIERRFSDIEKLIEKTIDYHLDVFDKKIPGNQFCSGGVYGIERYLCATQDHDYHLRDVRRAVASYLAYRVETYPSDLRMNWRWYLGFGASGAIATTMLSEIKPDATAAGIAVFGIGVFVLAFRRARKWCKSIEDLYTARCLVSTGDLDEPLIAALEKNRERYLGKFEVRDG